MGRKKESKPEGSFLSEEARLGGEPTYSFSTPSAEPTPDAPEQGGSRTDETEPDSSPVRPVSLPGQVAFPQQPDVEPSSEQSDYDPNAPHEPSEPVDDEMLRERMEQLKQAVPQTLFLTEEEKKMYDNFLYTIQSAEDRAVGVDVISYIIRQVNQESLMSVLEVAQYVEIVKKSLRGLFKKIYIEHYTNDLVKHDTLHASSRIFMVLMFLRMFKGRHYLFKMQELEAKLRPIAVGVR